MFLLARLNEVSKSVSATVFSLYLLTFDRSCENESDMIEEHTHIHSPNHVITVLITFGLIESLEGTLKD